MNINLIYSVIILFIISIIIINSSDISAIVSDLFVNQILFNEINTTMNNNTEIFKNSTSSKTCIMPECPSGKVCVQVCPESLPPI
ncbi:MAG TPA: hypothetical protein VF242_11640 [Nitrososphaeraceae archaeon]|jgi:hypothetical protein